MQKYVEMKIYRKAYGLTLLRTRRHKRFMWLPRCFDGADSCQATQFRGYTSAVEAGYQFVWSIQLAIPSLKTPEERER